MSGVVYEDVMVIDNVNLYEKFGFDIFVKFFINFYNEWDIYIVFFFMYCILF